MNIFKWGSKPEPQVTVVTPVEPTRTDVEFFNTRRSVDELPLPTVKDSGSGYVKYGEDNCYPQFLLSLLETSALHGGIVAGKAGLVAGGDFVVDGVPIERWRESASAADAASVQSFLNNAYGEHWSQIKQAVAVDWEVSGSFALEVIWSGNFSRVASVKRIPWDRLRPSPKDAEGEIASYWYSPDWASRRDEPVELQAFSVKAHVPLGEAMPEGHESRWDLRQVLYVRNHWPGFEYFGRPAYTSAISDIRTAATLSQWYLNAADGGFQPSVVVRFPFTPKSTEEQRKVARQVADSFTVQGGSKSKVVVLFGDSKDSMAEVSPIDIKNIDSQMVALSEKVNQSIVTGHAVTSPELVGVNVPGMLGTGDIATKYRIFETTVIGPSRRVIEAAMNEIASVSGVKQTITFEAVDPTGTTKVETTAATDGEPAAVADQAMNGSQVESLLNIITQCATGVISKETAVPLIGAAFPSLSEERVRAMIDGVVVTNTQPSNA